MTIKVLEKTAGCFPLELEQGDWYDLFLAESVELKAPQPHKMHIRNKHKEDVPAIRTRDVDFDSYIAKLGIAMELPEGYEAVVVPRSSSFKKYGILQSNSFGVIDHSYCSDKDEWGMPMTATRAVIIPKGTRIAQFRIQLSQKATAWQKIKWLFSSKPKLIRVASLANEERGGFGSTGN